MTNPHQAVNQPIAFHFLVLPHVPDGAESLFDEAGEPVFTNYDHVDWAGLAVSARTYLEDFLPKSAKLFVSNDGPDLMDIHGLSSKAKVVKDRGNFFSRVCAPVKKAKMKDMRAGVLNLASANSGLHLNEPDDGMRPPLAGLILTLKFKDMSQALDYIWGATDTLFGHGYMYETTDNPMLKQLNSSGCLAPCIQDWLKAQFKAVYSPKCTVLTLGITPTES